MKYPLLKVEYHDREEHELREAVLFVNVRGCGYPPDVSCQRFYATYGGNDTEPFNCYYSRFASNLWPFQNEFV